MPPEANLQRRGGRSSPGFSGPLASSGSLVASLQRWREQRRNNITHHQPQQLTVRESGAGPYCCAARTNLDLLRAVASRLEPTAPCSKVMTWARSPKLKQKTLRSMAVPDRESRRSASPGSDPRDDQALRYQGATRQRDFARNESLRAVAKRSSSCSTPSEPREPSASPVQRSARRLSVFSCVPMLLATHRQLRFGCFAESACSRMIQSSKSLTRWIP